MLPQPMVHGIVVDAGLERISMHIIPFPNRMTINQAQAIADE